jgi:hypothetical protein
MRIAACRCKTTCFKRRDEIAGGIIEKSVVSASDRRLAQPQVLSVNAAPKPEVLL